MTGFPTWPFGKSSSMVLSQAKISAFWFIANPPLNADMISGTTDLQLD